MDKVAQAARHREARTKYQAELASHKEWGAEELRKLREQLSRESGPLINEAESEQDKLNEELRPRAEHLNKREMDIRQMRQVLAADREAFEEERRRRKKEIEDRSDELTKPLLEAHDAAKQKVIDDLKIKCEQSKQRYLRAMEGG